MRFAMMCALVALSLVFVPKPARACGGMLFKDHESRPGGMSDQQVLIAHTPAKTVIVVSVGYAGSGGDFAFLLPLQKATSQVLDGDREIFVQLEEETAPRVIVEDATVAPPASSGGCACGGGAAKSGADYAAGPSRSVVVHDRGQTQTYDYVVLGGDDAKSVSAWLTKEGFQAPPSFQQAIDGYLSKGWLFLAAKLLAPAPEGNLAPLELHFDDVSLETLTYPFGMSAQSLAPHGKVGITLYLAGPRAFLPVDYAVAPIRAEGLVATSAVESNYDELFAEQAAKGGMVLEYGGAVNAFSLMDGKTAKTVSGLMGSTGTLTRLRARLSAEQLADAGFRVAVGEEAQQTNVHRVVWRGDGAALPKSGSLALGWLLVWAIAIARRRNIP